MFFYHYSNIYQNISCLLGHIGKYQGPRNDPETGPSQLLGAGDCYLLLPSSAFDEFAFAGSGETNVYKDYVTFGRELLVFLPYGRILYLLWRTC
jgi:hypothetical protein